MVDYADAAKKEIDTLREEVRRRIVELSQQIGDKDAEVATRYVEYSTLQSYETLLNVLDELAGDVFAPRKYEPIELAPGDLEIEGDVLWKFEAYQPADSAPVIRVRYPGGEYTSLQFSLDFADTLGRATAFALFGKYRTRKDCVSCPIRDKCMLLTLSRFLREFAKSAVALGVPEAWLIKVMDLATSSVVAEQLDDLR